MRERFFLFFFPLSFCLVVISATAQPQIREGTELRFPPRLTAALDTTVIRSERFGGIVIEEETVSELCPLLTTLFFEVGQDSLPRRFKQFRYPEQRENFADSTIPGGTLQKYRHILNIIGYRMNRFPDTRIGIRGGYSKEAGENKKLAEDRADAIYRYLRDMWQITPERMRMLPPEQPHGNRTDTMLQAELRFARIESDHWEIIRPLHIREVRRFVDPDSLRLRIDPMMSPGDIRSCRLRMSRQGKVLHEEEFPWHPDSAALTLVWKWLTDDMEIPAGEREIVVTAAVNRIDGTSEISPEVRIPVRTVEADRIRCFTMKIIDRFTLVLFSRESETLSIAQQRILREYVADGVRPKSNVKITGYADFGEKDKKKKLSEARAAAVAEYLRNTMQAGHAETITAEGAGSEQPLYTNDLPEGRCYNRTVQIVIGRPRIEE